MADTENELTHGVDVTDLSDESIQLVAQVLNKFTDALRTGRGAVLMLETERGHAEMVHLGTHETVVALIQFGFNQYMFNNTSRPEGVTLQ